MSGFAREALAATRSGRRIVPSKLGSNASRAHADWAASAWKIHFGMGLTDSRRRKARAVGAIVKATSRLGLGCRSTMCKLTKLTTLHD